LSCLF
jgi:hypothetical protein